MTLPQPSTWGGFSHPPITVLTTPPAFKKKILSTITPLTFYVTFTFTHFTYLTLPSSPPSQNPPRLKATTTIQKKNIIIIIRKIINHLSLSTKQKQKQNKKSPSPSWGNQTSHPRKAILLLAHECARFFISCYMIDCVIARPTMLTPSCSNDAFSHLNFTCFPETRRGISQKRKMRNFHFFHLPYF